MKALGGVGLLSFKVPKAHHEVLICIPNGGKYRTYSKSISISIRTSPMFFI